MHRFTLTVTSKGQFTLPVEARTLMNVVPGDRIELFVTRGGESLMRPLNKPASAIFGRGAAYADHAGSNDGRMETIGAEIASRGKPARARKAG